MINRQELLDCGYGDSTDSTADMLQRLNDESAQQPPPPPLPEPNREGTE